jgi:hypothetical protein
MSGQERMQVPETINARDIATLTARLAQVLAEEVDHLQEEKKFLTNALDAHKKMIARHPHLMDTIPSQDKSDLQGIVAVFEDILEENHRRLRMARDVNRKVVETVSQVVREASTSPVYSAAGQQGGMGNLALSVTLNQTV